MTTLAERALAIRLASIKSNTEIHDRLLAEAIDFAVRDDAIALFESTILAQSKDSLEPMVSGRFYINMDAIAAIGPFAIRYGDWTIQFPLREGLLFINISDFYKGHPLVIKAIEKLSSICGPSAHLYRANVQKDGNNWNIVITASFTLPQQLS